MIITMARKNYSMEFRQQAVDLYETMPGATLKQIAGELGVSRGTLSLWVKDLGNGVRTNDGPTPATPPSGESPVARIAGYSHLAVVPWLVKRCCRARWALRSRIRVW